MQKPWSCPLLAFGVIITNYSNNDYHYCSSYAVVVVVSASVIVKSVLKLL